MIRLNKFIAMSGITSRRKADELILAGKVSINGIVHTELGTRIDPNEDIISINGKELEGPKELVYYIINKPRDYICARRSQFGDKLITELLPKEVWNLSTVGRLDKNTTGLLIATNDGELINSLTQPSSKCEKEYMVKIQGELSDKKISELKKGVEIEVENCENTYTHLAKPKVVKILKRRPERTVISMVLEEGKKRQIRLMMNAIGYKRIDLKRIRISNLKLGELGIGKYRKLSKEEVNSLKSSI